MAKIFVAIPTYNKQVDIEIMQMFARLLGEYPEHEFMLDFIQSSLISYARNYLVQRFLATDADWLYFWDADVVIRNIKFLALLLETSKKLDAKVVGGAYKLKGPTGKYASGNKGKQKGNLVDIKNFDKLKKPKIIDALTTGSMLIHREVLEAIPDPWFHVVDLPKGKFIPEDYNFCDKARAAGFKVAIDPRFNTYHFGTAFWEHSYP